MVTQTVIDPPPGPPADLSKMPPLPAFPVTKFGTFQVTRQLFYLTPHSFALVNLKPLLPGHVLVCPRRVVPRYTQLSAAEVADLSIVTQKVSRTIERLYSADALNIAIQDGVAAGQSVPHVHVHIIPRRSKDLDHRGGTDAIYDMMDGEEGNVGKHLRDELQRQDSGEVRMLKGQEFVGSENGQHKVVKPDVPEDRPPRTAEDMEEEARWLTLEMSKDHGSVMNED